MQKKLKSFYTDPLYRNSLAFMMAGSCLCSLHMVSWLGWYLFSMAAQGSVEGRGLQDIGQWMQLKKDSVYILSNSVLIIGDKQW